MKNRIAILVELFFTFLKMGAIAFGGGYAIMPILDREVVKKKQWASFEEIIEYYAIAQVTPGVIAVNVSSFIGYKKGGALGAVIATCAFMIPGIAFVIIAASFLKQFNDIQIVQNAFAGIRLTIGALILGTVISLIKSFIKKNRIFLLNFLSVAICIVCFVMSYFFKTNPIFLIAAAAGAGFLFYRKSV